MNLLTSDMRLKLFSHSLIQGQIATDLTLGNYDNKATTTTYDNTDTVDNNSTNNDNDNNSFTRTRESFLGGAL